METKHTPGEWMIRPSSTQYDILNDTPFPIAILENKYRPVEVIEANAKLIAAAPNLLKQLQQYVDFCERHPDRMHNNSFYNDFKKAIKKATE